MISRAGWLVVFSGLGLCILSCAKKEVVPPIDRPIVIGVHSLPLSLDPYERNQTLAFAILFNIYDRLAHYETGLKAGPGLATGWVNPNDLTWLFQIREGVLFHDGRELTAEDVEASLKRARGPTSEMSTFLAEVASIRSVDRYEIEIVTHRPAPILPAKLSFIAILPADAPASIENPVGTGPYRFAGFEGDDTMRLERVVDSWHGPGGPSQASFMAIAEPEERLQALFDKRVDLIHEVPADRYDLASSTPGIRGATLVSRLVEYLHLHPEIPPFDDLRVRRAIDFALDRNAILERSFGGHGLPATQMISPEAFGFDAALRVPDHDVEESRRLLAEAGYSDGIDLELSYRESRRGEVIRDQLAEAGIRVRLRPASWQVVHEQLTQPGLPFYYGGIVSTTGDGSDVLEVFAHSREGPEGRGRGNRIQYSNPELDKMIEAASVELNPRARRGLLQACFGRLRDDAVYLPLVVPNYHFLMNAELVWEPEADGLLDVIEMAWKPKR